MRIACIYWYTKSVGGIATHLNSLRLAATANGDTFDILHSRNWKNKKPCLFPKRKWINGGDTKIWVDGEVPQTEEAAKWLNNNYDAIFYGFICPHKNKGYEEPHFKVLYLECTLPKIAFVMDGYWDDYSDWSEPVAKYCRAIFCPLESYAMPLRNKGIPRVKISPFPFIPKDNIKSDRSKEPLLVWPNQWKEIKGTNTFLKVLPQIPQEVNIEMYSTGIQYFRLRSTKEWKKGVGLDCYDTKYSGDGKAIYYGNVDLDTIIKAYQEAWFTVNLQGVTSRRDTYKAGSYNNTEVEALYYGAIPILHSSVLKTDIPKECIATVRNAYKLPDVIKTLISNKTIQDPVRRKRAKEFVLDKHLAYKTYKDIRNVL